MSVLTAMKVSVIGVFNTFKPAACLLAFVTSLLTLATWPVVSLTQLVTMLTWLVAIGYYGGDITSQQKKLGVETEPFVCGA